MGGLVVSRGVLLVPVGVRGVSPMVGALRTRDSLVRCGVTAWWWVAVVLVVGDACSAIGVLNFLCWGELTGRYMCCYMSST